jgi:hypothetical protein
MRKEWVGSICPETYNLDLPSQSAAAAAAILLPQSGGA